LKTATKNRLTSSAHLNPTLSVLAYFMVQVGDDSRRTRLDLRRYPEAAAWLLSILEYILYRQGKLPEERGIAQPPGGEALQHLIDGQVILTTQRPDGGLAMRLNPAFDLRLQITARRHGLPALDEQITLAGDPDLTRWLLTEFVRKEPEIDPARLGDRLVEALRRYAILIDEPPDDPAWYPDPSAPVDLATALAAMARVIRQSADEPIPAEVRTVLGRHTPALPPAVSIVWGQDAATGMVYPVCWDEQAKHTDPAKIAGRDAASRAAKWAEQLEMARESIRSRRYAIIRDIVPPAQRASLRRYVRQLKERGYFPELNDGQVVLRASIHNEPTIASLHNGLAGIVNSIGVEPVIPSYCFLGCYEAGAVLERHLDRPQCAYNVCLVMDMQYLDRDDEPEPWPIYLELDGKPEAALLGVGDGIFFAGKDIFHWRDAQPAGRRTVVCFNHFVPPDFTGSLD
jgi:hypothetical protein